jgi:LysM domain
MDDRHDDRASLAHTVRPTAAVQALLVVLALSVACVPTPANRPSVSATASATVVITARPTPAGPTAPPSFTRPTPTPLPTFLAYVVRPGDRLTTIATRFATTARSIAYWNAGTYPSLNPASPAYDPDLIRIGWTLVLIPGVIIPTDVLPTPSPSPTPGPSASDPGSTAGASPSSS